MAKRRKRRYGEGSVYRCRRTGRWVAAVMVAGERRMAYADTEERAERLRATLATGRIPPAQQTLAAYLLEWLADLEASGSVRPNTLKNYEQSVRLYISPHLGRLRLERVTPRDAQAWSAAITERVSPSAARFARTVLSIALRRAVRLEVLDRNVVALTSPPPPARTDRRAMSDPDRAALIRAMSGHRLEALYLLALSTGMRLGECLGLAWSEVDLERRRLAVVRQMQRGELVEVKTATSRRVVSFPEVAALALARHGTGQKVERVRAGASWRDLGLVFPDRDGGPLNGNRVREGLGELCASAGIGHYRFHELRHTAASALLNDGESLKTIASLLGHKKISTTADLYAHTDEAAKDRAAARFDRLLSPTAE